MAFLTGAGVGLAVAFAGAPGATFDVLPAAFDLPALDPAVLELVALDTGSFFFVRLDFAAAAFGVLVALAVLWVKLALADLAFVGVFSWSFACSN